MNAPAIPPGFTPNPRKSPLTDPWEPMYWKQTEDAIVIGLRLDTPHTNARGLIDGGLIAALADKGMCLSCGFKLGSRFSLVTVNLSVDYIGSAKIGQWLAVESEVLKSGRTICFVQSIITADDEPIARANATFRVVPRSS